MKSWHLITFLSALFAGVAILFCMRGTRNMHAESIEIMDKLWIEAELLHEKAEILVEDIKAQKYVDVYGDLKKDVTQTCSNFTYLNKKMDNIRELRTKMDKYHVSAVSDEEDLKIAREIRMLNTAMEKCTNMFPEKQRLVREMFCVQRYVENLWSVSYNGYNKTTAPIYASEYKKITGKLIKMLDILGYNPGRVDCESAFANSLINPKFSERPAYIYIFTHRAGRNLTNFDSSKPV